MESASVCGNRPQSDDRQYSIVMETAAAAHVQSNRRQKSSVKATGLNRVSPTAMILVLCESVSLRRGDVSDFLRHQSGPSCHRRCYLRCPICRHLPGRVVVDKIPACMAPGEISRMATAATPTGCVLARRFSRGCTTDTCREFPPTLAYRAELKGALRRPAA